MTANPRPVFCFNRLILDGPVILLRLEALPQGRELPLEASRQHRLRFEADRIDKFTLRVRPAAPLPPGEYAWLAGPGNLNIYAFTVTAAPK